jgi:hypothetical protein
MKYRRCNSSGLSICRSSVGRYRNSTMWDGSYRPPRSRPLMCSASLGTLRRDEKRYRYRMFSEVGIEPHHTHGKTECSYSGTISRWHRLPSHQGLDEGIALPPVKHDADRHHVYHQRSRPTNVSNNVITMAANHGHCVHHQPRSQRSSSLAMPQIQQESTS